MVTRSTATDTLIRVGVIVLTFGTALTHMSLLFPDVVFLLNGFGYFVLLGALYLPIPPLIRYRRYLRWLLIGYTLLTMALWFMFGLRTWLGYANKLNELALLTLLVIEDRRTQRLSRA